MSTPPVVLASQSPRRRELLTLIGITHVVDPADVDETVRGEERPDAYVERLAREKAAVVAARHAGAVVIAADTTVVQDGEILGKPGDVREAVEMLSRLSGHTHEVFTGIAVAAGGRVVSAVERVEVTFRDLTLAEISAYVATGEPMDKAGAYGIQGWGATIVERIHGDYFSVMGLGLRRLVALLEQAGVGYAYGRGVTGD
ncbi:MAG: septum formation inhibitor Maf [Gemmatimonadetes bacterium]|nr:septum formation inhibitor Maf [Gemmatimonadota bacterium]